MKKYDEFLENINVISEEQFNDVINSLPDVDISEINFDVDNRDGKDEISETIINFILSSRWNCYAYVCDVDFNKKEFYLDNVESLEDLIDIKLAFEKWTIINYEELKTEILEENIKDEINEKLTIANNLLHKLSLEQLNEIINTVYKITEKHDEE